MCRVLRVLFGFVLGALVGAGLVLLFAPQSGAETRRVVQERIQLVRAEAEKAAEARRLELMAQFEALKQPTPDD